MIYYEVLAMKKYSEYDMNGVPVRVLIACDENISMTDHNNGGGLVYPVVAVLER